VIVEASGLADPVLLLEILASAELMPIVRPGLILTLVDAAGWNRAAMAMGELLRRQVGLADWILVNKADLATEAAMTALSAKLKELNPAAQIEPSIQGEADFSALWNAVFTGTNESRAAVQAEGTGEHAASHTFFCPVPHPVERSKLVAALSELGPEVWRAKGFLRLRGESGLWLLQYVAEDSAGQHQLAPVHLPFGMEEPELGLVFIGAHLPVEDLMRAFGGHRLLALF
jgi:G3E family GTPase